MKRLRSSVRGRRAAAVMVGVSALVLAMAVGIGVTAQLGWSFPTADATVRASATATGSSARSLVDTGSADRPGQEWRSGSATPGTWVELSWTRLHEVHTVVLVGSDDPALRIRAGFLSFGDGSQVHVQFPEAKRQAKVAVNPRTVDRVRFTVTEVAQGSTSVGLAELVVSTEDDDDGVVIGGSGNVAVHGKVSGSNGPDAMALTDGGPDGTGASWSSPNQNLWAQVDWSAPQELSAVQLVGAAGGQALISNGRLEFEDGSTVFVGGVLDAPGRPTTVAFMPRVTRSLRFVADGVTGTGTVVLAELRAWRIGATPARQPGPENVPRAPGQSGSAQPECPAGGTTARPGVLTVLCPTATTELGGPTEVRFAAPGFRRVESSAWGADGSSPKVAGPVVDLDGQGEGAFTIDLSTLPRGPVTVELTASGGRAAASTHLQVYNTSHGVSPDASAQPTVAAAGKTLVYAEEFSDGLSVSRDGRGADYAAAKPVVGGAEDFGEAIFPDPKLGFDNLTVVDDRHLRIAARPNPPGYSDPGVGQRSALGGLVASARTGGSGFAAQYGYFEARMTTPAGEGTWPAFWMLPSTVVTAPQTHVAEIDAMELYGTDPLGACHSTHAYTDGRDVPNTQCGRRFPNHQAAFGWHTYGVLITPTSITFTIDGRTVAEAPQVVGGDQPMFFMTDLALGGGWPVDLSPVGGRAATYVDYVRVYV